MKKTLIALLSLTAILSYSQEKGIKSGTYISTKQTEKLKLNLLDGNKYELVFLYGNYEKKGDTLYLGNQVGKKSCFSVKFGSDAAISNSVQIKLKSKYITTYMAQIYVGMQDGSLPVQYKRLSELVNNDNLDYDAEELSFTVNRSQYLYFVHENYEGKVSQSKYTIPNKVSEIAADFEINGFADLQLKGYYNKENDAFVIADLLGKNPLEFKPEDQTANEIKNEVLPDEVKNMAKWTYEGKDKPDSEMGYAIADSAAAVGANYNFKLKTENNLTDALKTTKKTASKYLVLYYDPKNKDAKKEFDEFLQNQSTDISYNLYDGYDAKYDLYNYYLITDKDKNWIKKNNINESPSVVVINSDGLVLSKSKGTLDVNKNIFYYYDTFYSKLNRINAVAAFSKSINAKKISDAALLKAFAQVSALDNFDLSNDPYAAIPEPAAVYVPNDRKIKETEEIAPVIEEPDTASVTEAVYDVEQYKLTEVKLDKNQIETYWKRLLKSHQQDTKPDMDLVGIISKEIKNEGFSKQFFKVEKPLDKTNFEAIQYLLKHYDAIVTEEDKVLANNPNGLGYPVEKIGKVISDALYKNYNSLATDGVSVENQKSAIEIYKQLIDKDKSNLDINRNYFYLLGSVSEKLHMESFYIEEYDAFFNELFDGKTGIIEKIDDLFIKKDSYNYESWADFKNYFSNLSNEVAWFVVTKSNNPEHVKKAIKWSESSAVIFKNNAYYLDTLARLYYKNGEKEKAVKTQEQAVKYSEGIDEETKSDIEAALQKMKNGTY